ncbi:helicase [Lysinibacillus xylanilyticus]|uniref:helicase-related protein n=1 Tax=Lysinibacillus xylanilyticus TaxID=582475 RepID=UPI002B252AD6|nr:helicase-related protein [Lysinibacillus xylanilyticus]MEB2301535.1 helicase [Lysinibacillus xylanilyticus]
MTEVVNYLEQEKPKMLDVYVKQAWHSAFCYAAAYKEVHNRYGLEKVLLLAVVSGADSALQSMKACIDMGTSGALRFGHGVKSNTDYQFQQEYGLATEKGRYEKFPMNLSGTRKGYILLHDDLLDKGKYLISFDSNPANDVAALLGGPPFGLWIEEEWKEIVYKELRQRGHLIPVDFYKDPLLFDDVNEHFHLFEVALTEEQADSLISELLKNGTIKFKRNGSGSALKGVQTLDKYALGYNDMLIEKLAEQVQPTHDASKMVTHPKFEKYKRELFPVQAHASTAIAKRLKTQKSVILQGEMSTGKSTMMTAIADGLFSTWDPKGKDRGYHVCLMSPPSLMDKWPKEIRNTVPNAKVILVRKTEELIRYHTDWTNKGRPKPQQPVFFVISYTTMRDGARIQPGVTWDYRATEKQKGEDDFYRAGYYCPSCGQAHQAIESKETYIDESDGLEKIRYETYNMTPKEFGKTRRLHKTVHDPNAFCFHCGDSLWTNKVANRYQTFADWTKHEKTLLEAIAAGDTLQISSLSSLSNSKPKSSKGLIRKVAAIEYIRRKMKNFFDIAIVDEVHMCKADNTAQGNALGSLAAAAKKVIAGTGTLFGGKSMDVYYLLWRLFPSDMAKSGYQYSEVGRFNNEFGNVEKRTFVSHKSTSENSNTNSRGGVTRYPDKLLPGISPFIYGKYMLHNVVNVRLKDVWPDSVPLIDTPTIFVPMDKETAEVYNEMMSTFDRVASGSPNPGSIYRIMMDYGIAMPDNPYSIPHATIKNPESGELSLLWKATHIDSARTTPKEAKLQEIIRTEMAQGRKSIIYVRDTGSTNPARDVRPRLKQKLEEIGAKVCILDTTSAPTDKRSQWLNQKIEEEGHDVCIVSQELVKVGLDLLCTPTLIFYQFSWSLFTINQAARRAWRIGQDQECRLFYLAYQGSMQQEMAYIIASKNRATAAINGELSSDGLSAMLGDDGDLRSMLLKSVKEGNKTLKGSAEDWISQTSDRAREILANIGRTDVAPTERKQILNKQPQEEESSTFVEELVVKKDDVVNHISEGAKTTNGAPDLFDILEKSIVCINVKSLKKKEKSNRSVTDGQLAFDLFE